MRHVVEKSFGATTDGKFRIFYYLETEENFELILLFYSILTGKAIS
jgi:hypothetical protein